LINKLFKRAVLWTIGNDESAFLIWNVKVLVYRL